MAKQASLLSRLESIVGPEGARPDDEVPAFAVDGLIPQAAVAPATYEQVAAVMRYANAEALAVIPWGGGTHMHIGNVPRRYDIALSLSPLDRVVEHEPADLTVTCQAGITLGELQKHLARHGQMVPLDSPREAEATIGGILAANAAGPSRHAFGTPRDFTIGMKVVTADGRVTKAGGRVVKNVAGYDLCKLYIGSLGTLGIIVEAAFKLAPLPRAERTVIAGFESAGEGCAFAAEARRRRLSLRALQLLNAPAASAAGLSSDEPSALVLNLAGTSQAVERSQRELEELARGASAALRDGEDAADLQAAIAGDVSPQGSLLLCKIAALPTRLPSLTTTLEGMGETPRILALPTVGVLYASWPHLDNADGTVGELRSLVSRVGGSLVLERCPLEVKQRLDVFPDASGPSFELMRRVKQEFDPKGVLSPGRQVGRL